MRIIWKIAKAELQTLFFSPLAWLMLVVFGILVFGYFYDAFDIAVRTQEIGEFPGHITRKIFLDQEGIYAKILNELYYFFPLLTMGLISREKISGGIKLLDSSPVTTGQVVMGKYFSMCLFSLLLVLILFLPVITGLFTVDHLEVSAILTGLAGLYLLMCTYSAIGLLMSSLSPYPIVAAVGTFGILAALNYVGSIGQSYEFIRDLTYWMAISQRIVSFLSGIISSADVIYYLLVIILCLVFTWLKLRFAKLSLSLLRKTTVYLGVFIAVILSGYLSSLPSCRFYADMTTDQRNTLSAGSREIMKEVEGKVRITSYVNILNNYAQFLLPSAVNADKARFEQYMRFHPDMELRYVYYYGETDNPSFYTQNSLAQGIFPDSMARRLCKIEGLNPKKLKTQAEAQQLCPFDLAGENNPVIRSIEIEGVGVRPLRMFNDNKVLPSEQEISAAFKGMVSDLPQVLLLTGYGSGDMHSKRKAGYDLILNTPLQRMSLINQGFLTGELILGEEGIPEGTSVLIISNPTETYGDDIQTAINEYIARGGNLLLMADAGNEEEMNKIAASLGIRFTPGYLVEVHDKESDILPHIVICDPLPATQEIDAAFNDWHRFRIKQPLRMATSICLDSFNPLGFEYLPLFVSPSASWLKQERVNLMEEIPVPDPARGEKQDSYTTIAALRRPYGGREQRIIVTSDAEWLTNIGLSTQYTEVKTSPVGLALSLFKWMVYEQVPVNISRGSVNDTRINFRDTDLDWIYYLYIWILPVLMGLTGFYLYYQRNKQ